VCFYEASFRASAGLTHFNPSRFAQKQIRTPPGLREVCTWHSCVLCRLLVYLLSQDGWGNYATRKWLGMCEFGGSGA